MNRLLVSTPTFIRAAKRFLRKHPDQVESMRLTLSLMEMDVFQQKLRSHKLKGELEGRWACSAGYDVRIVFMIGVVADKEVIQLLSIGSHDEVY
jgi:mRNA-degrading endonuclease YafQ of YafQ-DinJ toxin-antitoxin module